MTELPEPWRMPDGVAQKFEFVRVHDGTAYIGGHGPVEGTTIKMQGVVGGDLTVDDGYESARLTALAITASLQRAVGQLGSITWLWSRVYVNAGPGLEGPALTRVADGFRDAVEAIFGDRGRHARATIGVTSLPFGVPTIIDGAVAV